MKISQRRQEVYLERLNLKTKPRLNMQERARLAELGLEWCRLLICGNNK
jgi:hypothetical protein